jgi:HEAT repeat protein
VELRQTLESADDAFTKVADPKPDDNDLGSDLGPLLTDACDRVVVVEDRSDASFLRSWMEKVLAPEQWARLSHRRFCLEFKRRPTGDEVNQRLDTIRQIHPDEVNLQPKAFVVADRDYRLEEELEEERKKLHGKDFSRQTWHVWQRVEIENYLICPDAIVRYVVSRLHAADLLSADAVRDEAEVRALIDEAIEASRLAVRDHLLDSFGPRRRAWTLSRTVREVEQFLDREWRAEGKRVWCDGKEVVFPHLRRQLKERWNLALSDRDLIETFTMDEIPDEVKETVRDIAEFLLGARWTSLTDSHQAAIQPLVVALKSSDPAIRERAAESLGKKGVLAVPSLIGALGDSCREVRVASINSLAQIVPPAAQATEALAQLLDDTDSEVRELAARALGIIGPGARAAVRRLVNAVRQTDWRLRCEAASALGKIGVAGDAVTVLREALRDKSIPARDIAAQALGAIGTKAGEAVSDLLASLNDDAAEVQTQVAIALGKIGIADEPVLAGLVKALKDGQVDVRRGVLEGLIAMGPKATPVAGVLAGVMQDSDEVCRKLAAQALGKLAAQALGKLARPQMELIDALAPGLGDQAWTVRKASAESLGELGSHAAATAPFLEKAAMSDENGVVRATAASALVLVGGDAPAAVRSLVEALGGDDRAARKVAAEKLGVIGPAAFPAVPALAEALADGDFWVRFAAATTLGKLGSSAASAVPALAAAFADDYPEPRTPGRITWGDGPVYDLVRVAAAQTLGGLGKAAGPALPVLRGTSAYQRAVQEAATQAVRLIEEAQRQNSNDETQCQESS